MRTRYLLIIVVLLCTIALAVAAAVYFASDESVTPQSSETGETKNALDQPAEKTPQQQMHDIVDCAALLAVHESRTGGEFKPDTPLFNLISYALGKAQELALQTGLEKSAARTLYDEKTLGYFLAYADNPEGLVSQNTGKATHCEKQLREYEPGAQIQSTIKKAQDMARQKQP